MSAGRRRWVVLAVGTAAQSSQAAVAAGLAVLAPALRDRYHLSLTGVGMMLGIAAAGSTLTLLPWGIAADRLGERLTGTAGLAGAALVLGAAASEPRFALFVLLLAVAGGAGASVNTATGRAVTSWFPRAERGFALGIRQTSVPIGSFAAALGLPPIESRWGSGAALGVLAVYSLVAAALAVVGLVQGPEGADELDEADALRHPVRDRRIWRLSSGSAALIFAQVAVTGFVVLFLHSERGLSTIDAGLVLAGINVVGAAGRLLSGRRSDVRAAGRVGLIRAIAVGAAVALGAAAALTGASLWLLVPALVVGGGLSMSWNGLSVTAIVELAGIGRRGAALGLQQTVLGVSVVATPFVFATLVHASSWRVGFAAASLAPVVAWLVLRPLRV